jgi:hypothetical protein
MDRTVFRLSAGMAAVMALAMSAPARAQTRRLDDEPVTPRMMALGGRAEALSNSTSALFANPAALTASRVYHADGYVLYDPTASRFSSGSAVVDSTRNSMAAGLSYLFTTTGDEADKRSAHDVRFNLSFPIGNVLGIGTTIRYLNVSAGPPAPDGSSLTAQGWGGFTFDAGLFLKPVSWLQISASGHNLNNPDTTAAPISVGGGVALIPTGFLSVVADVLVDFRMHDTARGRYSGGVELFLANHYPLRAGYLYDDTRGGAQAITAGLGYLDESFGLEIGLRQGIVPEPQTTLMLSARYFYRPPQQQ